MDILHQLVSLLRDANIRYAICGGYAIDLFIGQRTRTHKDLDVVAFVNERDIIIHHMLNIGWSIYEPCGGEYLHKISSIANQKRIKTNIWCVKTSNTHYQFREHDNTLFTVEHDGSEQTELDFIEFLFNEHTDGHFLYARNRDIKRDIDKAILSSNGIMYLAPELVLLYKSTQLNNTVNQIDFINILPLLGDERKAWLRKALDTAFENGHEWRNKII